MKRQRHSPEQIIRKLRTADQFLNQGQIEQQKLRSRIRELARGHVRWGRRLVYRRRRVRACQSIKSGCKGSGERKSFSARCRASAFGRRTGPG